MQLYNLCKHLFLDAIYIYTCISLVSIVLYTSHTVQWMTSVSVFMFCEFVFSFFNMIWHDGISCWDDLCVFKVLRQASVCVCVCMRVPRVCVCVCVRYREREREKRFLRNYWSHHQAREYIKCSLYWPWLSFKITVLNHEYNKCSIISRTFQAMPINFAVNIVRLKVYTICTQSDDLDCHSRSQLCLQFDNFYIRRFQLWHSNSAWR